MTEGWGFFFHMPASVIAETVKNRLSVKETLRNGVDEPQKIIAETRHVDKKYR